MLLWTTSQGCISSLASLVLFCSCALAQQRLPETSAPLPEGQLQIQSKAVQLANDGHREAAIALLQRALQEHPESRALHLELARQFAFLKRYPEAKQQYAEVLRSDPQNLSAQVGIAKVLSWEGDLNSGLAAFDRILARSPHLYDARVGKGFTLLWMGQKTEAYRWLRAAAADHPEDNEVAETVAQLKKQLPPQKEVAAALPPAAMSSLSSPRSRRNVPRSAKRTLLPENSFPEPISPAQALAPASSIFQSPLFAAMVLVSTVLFLLISNLVWQRRPRLRLFSIVHSAMSKMALNGKPPKAPGQHSVPDASAVSDPTVNINFSATTEVAVDDAAAAAAAPSLHQPAVHLTPEPHPGSQPALLRGRILIIDPNPQVAAFAEMVLSGAGAYVQAVTGGRQAIDALRGGDFDLLLMDAHMEDVGWRDLQQWLRQNRPGLSPQMLLCCSGGYADAQRLEFHTGLRCLARPFRMSDLLETARNTLAAGRYRTVVSGPPPSAHPFV